MIKIVFSDQSLVKTNNQSRLNMHQTQSFLENQTNIPEILLLLGSEIYYKQGKLERKTALSEPLSACSCLVIGYSTDPCFPWKSLVKLVNIF